MEDDGQGTISGLMTLHKPWLGFQPVLMMSGQKQYVSYLFYANISTVLSN